MRKTSSTIDQKQGYSKVREQYANLTKYEPRNGQAEPSTVVGREFQVNSKSWWATVLEG